MSAPLAVIAFVRELSRSFSSGAPAQPSQIVNVPLAQKQHAALVAALRELAARVEFVAAPPEHPNGVFVADTAVLLPEVAIIARPADAARAAEITTVTRALAKHRPVQSIVDPATLCGCDVVRIGRTLVVAESQRTNADGVSQVREIALPYGYNVRTLPARECPPLKDTCTFVAPQFVVLDPAWIAPELFDAQVVIPMEPREAGAASTLTVGRTTLVSAACPRTEQRLRHAGIGTRKIDVSEFERVGRGLASLALVLESRSAGVSAEPRAMKPIEAPGTPGTGGHASQAIVHGGLIYVSPQRPFEPASGKMRRMSAEEQTEQAIQNVSAVLAAAGSSLDRVLRATVYIADPKHISAVDAAFARMFAGHRPVRAIVASGALPSGILVEVEAVAAAGGGGQCL